MIEYVYEITINEESTPYSCMDVSLEAAILQIKDYLGDDTVEVTKVFCLGVVDDEDLKGKQNE